MRRQAKTFTLSTILLILVTMTTCRFNSQYLNREEDKRDAEKITNELFKLMTAKDYEATTKLFSKKFFEVTDKEKLFKIFSMTSEKLGVLERTEILTWETRRVEGSNPVADYAFVYKCTYEKFPAKTTIRLTREEDGQIRIISYNINSDGFLNI
jgi:hypothetical protein